MSIIVSSTPCARALFRVFVQPSLIGPSLPADTSILIRQPQLPLCLSSCRRNVYRYSKPVRERSMSPSELHTLDEAISSRTIHLVDDTNTLQHNLNLQATLRNLDRTTTHLRQVSIDESSGIPICRTVTKKQLWEEAKLKRKESKKKDVDDMAKQIELSWGIDTNDLGHRLKRLQEFLREGRRVEVLVARKKRGRRATDEEMENLLEKVKEAANGVKGTEEWKDMEGEIGRQTMLYFQCDREMNQETEDVEAVGQHVVASRSAMEDKQAKKEREKQERKEKEERRMQRKREEEESKEKAKRLVL